MILHSLLVSAYCFSWASPGILAFSLINILRISQLQLEMEAVINLHLSPSYRFSVSKIHFYQYHMDIDCYEDFAFAGMPPGGLWSIVSRHRFVSHPVTDSSCFYAKDFSWIPWGISLDSLVISYLVTVSRALRGLVNRTLLRENTPCDDSHI